MSLMEYIVLELLIELELLLDALTTLVTLALLGTLAIGGSGDNGEVDVKTELKFNWYDGFGNRVIFWQQSPRLV